MSSVRIECGLHDDVRPCSWMDEFAAFRRRRSLSSSALVEALAAELEEPVPVVTTASLATSDTDSVVVGDVSSNEKRCLELRMLFGTPELGDEDAAVAT